MTKWDDSFQEHDIHNSINNFKNTIESVKEIDHIVQQDRLDDIIRLEQIAKYAENKLKLIDPNLIHRNLLHNLDNDFQDANNQLNSYKNSKNLGHINNANKNSDTILNRLSNLNVFIGEEDFGNLSENITSFKRSIGQHQRNLHDKIEEVENRVPSINNKLDGLKDEIQQQKQRTDEIITKFQNQFSTTEENRREEYSENKSERESAFEELKQKINKDYKATLDEKETEAETLLSSIEKQKEKASKIVKIISNSGMAGGFEEVASNEKDSRNVFRVLAGLAFLGLIGFGFYVFHSVPEGGLSWSAIGIRIFVASTIGIFIAFLVKQAEKHDRHYRQNKIIALQMEALDPYLSKLDTAEQKEVKKELISNFFRKYDAFDKKDLKSGEFVTRGSFQDLFQMIKNLTN